MRRVQARHRHERRQPVGEMYHLVKVPPAVQAARPANNKRQADAAQGRRAGRGAGELHDARRLPHGDHEARVRDPEPIVADADDLVGGRILAQYLQDGTFLDLMRVYADGSGENGYLLENRVNNEGAFASEASLSAGMWTVVFSRPLAGAVGDVALEAGKTYTVGFAIHDDFAAARFHHVRFV